MPADLLVYPGRALKMSDAGGLTFSGPLVVFSDAETPDLAGDYFTPDTYLGVLSDRGKAEYPAYFHHGLDPELKARPVGVVEAELRDDEVWATYWINERTDYEKRVAERLRKLNAKGTLGQSSGAVAHLVNRVEAKAAGGASWLELWPIGEGSLTPVPCEPRTFAKAFGAAPWDRAISLPEYAKRFAAPPEEGEAAHVLQALRDLRRDLATEHDLTHALRAARNELRLGLTTA